MHVRDIIRQGGDHEDRKTEETLSRIEKNTRPEQPPRQPGKLGQKVTGWAARRWEQRQQAPETPQRREAQQRTPVPDPFGAAGVLIGDVPQRTPASGAVAPRPARGTTMPQSGTHLGDQFRSVPGFGITPPDPYSEPSY